ncbi:MAG: DUF4405 domain-containing protein [Phycisphaerales bacterium]|nr:MAG: DUF4405 domain-containing protein [Phycisphaerales bacterium]
MKRNTLNFWIDLISLLVMLGLAWTGLLIHYVLPPGTGGRHAGSARTVWGLGRHDWGTIHFYLAVSLIGLMVVHVWLHWSWVCATVNKLRCAESASGMQRVVYGIVLLLIIAVVMGGGLFWANSQVKSAGEVIGSVTMEPHPASHALISGRTTLAEAARVCGMSVEELTSRLRLPATVNPNEQLGRLRRKYGFEIEDVRAIHQQHK